ncbi:MAG: hypothetical protein WB992_26525 [Bryobacteraceae bacterium]
MNTFQRGHAFVLFKGYFDGGNQPDSRRHKTVTLACVFGHAPALKKFAHLWRANLKRHGAAYLHTTDAVRLEGIYKDGWDEVTRDAFIQDCARILGDSILRQDTDGRIIQGLIPCSITIDLGDFKRVQVEVPSGPQNAGEVLATQAFTKMIEGGRLLLADFYELFFDRNEPYRGHIVDRIRNPRFIAQMKKNGIDIGRRVIVGPELDMRDVTELQAADLLAWCVGHKDTVKFGWQQSVLNIRREDQFLDRKAMLNPDPFTTRFVQHLKLPKRAATK